MKVMTILGTRPELIKMSMLIKKLDTYTQHIFVHTGQNYDYELNEIFYKDLGLRKPDYFLNVAADTLGQTIGNVISKTEEVLLKEHPDAIVILGDTNSALGAIIAKRMKIPIFHLEAGNRCFDSNVPEEINRSIMDHLSDINMVYTENQRHYLIKEGIHPGRIFVSGSPMLEVLSDKEIHSNILDELHLNKDKYYLVSLHRDENTEIQENFNNLVNTLIELSKEGLPIIVSTHPRTRKKIEQYNTKFPDNVILHKPFGFDDYLELQMNAKCVISDSGTISEESGILGFPAVTIRNAIERPEAIDNGSIVISPLNYEGLKVAIDVATNSQVVAPPGYMVDNFSERVLKVILGYTNYVNKYVWYKHG